MQIDRQLILRLEDLARLELSESERARLVSDLNNILRMVEQMDGLDTSGVEPLTYINMVESRLREDLVKNQLSGEAATSNAPDHDGQFFKVPKVL